MVYDQIYTIETREWLQHGSYHYVDKTGDLTNLYKTSNQTLSLEYRWSIEPDSLIEWKKDAQGLDPV